MRGRPQSGSASPRPPSGTSTSTPANCAWPKASSLCSWLAIDRVSKFVHVAFFDANTKLNGAAFLREVVQAFPYRIHTVLTDNGVAFTPNASTRWDLSRHVVDRVCDQHGIEHRLTRP